MVVQIPVVLYSGGYYPRGFRTLESNDTVPGTDITRVPISGGYMTGQLFAASGVVVSGTLSRNGFNVVTVGDVETVTSTMIASGTIIDADVNISGAINATKLSFLQAGASGVARTVDSKLKDVVSVKDFGAVGDGVTDDTVAIQVALNYAITTNAILCIPSGNTFLVSGTLTIIKPSGSRIPTYINGGGTLKKTNSGTLFNAQNNGTGDIYFENIFFLGDLSATVVGFDLNQPLIRTYFDKCSFRFLSTCFQSLTYIAQSIRVTNCIFTTIKTWVINVPYAINDFIFSGCHVEEMSTGGLFSGTGASITIENNVIENFTIAPVFDIKGCGSFIIKSNYFEDNTGGIVVCPITTNYFTGLIIKDNYVSLTAGNVFVRWGTNLLGCTSAGNVVNGGATNDVSATVVGSLATFNNWNVGFLPDIGSALYEVGKTFIGGSAAVPGITPSGDPNTGISSSGADQLAISTNGAARLSISATGTTTLNAAASTAPFIANIASSEAARINSSARLLVGTPTDLNVVGRISILYTSSVEAGISIQSSVDSYNTAISFLNTSGTQVGYISTAASSTAYSTSSDYRLKENVTPVPDGITRLQQLKPSRFNFIADPDYTVDGFLAHEVQDIVPEAITGEKDAVDADGKPVYQGIDQSKLVPLLTAALQEAIAKIETLEAKVATLEAA